MKRPDRTFLALVLMTAGLLILFQGRFAPASAGSMDLQFQKQTVSAKIDQTPVKAVIERICNQKGIWIKGKKNIPDTLYSVNFEGIQLRRALERILSSCSINYCLVLGASRRIRGLIFLPGEKKRTRPTRRPVRRPSRRPRRR